MNPDEPTVADSFLSRQLGRLPPASALVASRALSLLVGLAIAIVLHYVLYRLGLPSKPFIYVAF